MTNIYDDLPPRTPDGVIFENVLDTPTGDVNDISNLAVGALAEAAKGFAEPIHAVTNSGEGMTFDNRRNENRAYGHGAVEVLAQEQYADLLSLPRVGALIVSFRRGERGE